MTFTVHLLVGNFSFRGLYKPATTDDQSDFFDKNYFRTNLRKMLLTLKTCQKQYPLSVKFHYNMYHSVCARSSGTFVLLLCLLLLINDNP